MKIATFNVNGVEGRMPRLLEWLAEASPDVACPGPDRARREAGPPSAECALPTRFP
jgi:exonuclease III